MDNKKLFGGLVLLVFGAAIVFGIIVLLFLPGRSETSVNESSPTVVAEELPIEPTDIIEPELTEEPSSAQYWREEVDPRTNIRFAVPCYWEVEGITQSPDMLAFFTVRNYPESYVFEFPRGEGVFEAGGIKLDMGYLESETWGFPPDYSPELFATKLYENDSEVQLLGIENIEMNGQVGVIVTTNSNFGGEGSFYLFQIDPGVYFLVSAAPPEAINSADVQAILNSLALSDDVAVNIPTIMPGPPPPGLTASCIPDYAEPTQ